MRKRRIKLGLLGLSMVLLASCTSANADRTEVVEPANLVAVDSPLEPLAAKKLPYPPKRNPVDLSIVDKKFKLIKNTDPWWKERSAVADLKNKGYETVGKKDLFEPVSWKVGSFNILGHTHTTKGKSRFGEYPASSNRIGGAVDLIQQHGLSVVGLQEFQGPQVRAFNRMLPEYQVWPGLAGSYRMQNSIAWLKSDWELVKSRYIPIPYFHGRLFEMPLVQLRHKVSGQTVWFGNFHNPANVKGEAQAHRDKARIRQAEEANRLLLAGEKLVYTGDFNERQSYICRLSRATGMVSTGGTRWENDRCALGEDRNRIDLIIAGGGLESSGYIADFSSIKRKIADHPLIVSTITYPALYDRSSCEKITIMKKAQTFCRPIV